MDPDVNQKYRITRIDTQVHDPGRKSVFIEGEYAFSISLEAYLTAGFKAGDMITEFQIEQWRDTGECEKARNKALDYLALRMRSVKEMRDHLKKKAFSAEIINRVVNELLEKKYLDDAAFAGAFIRDQKKFNKNGRFKLKQKLLQKGITAAIADELIAEEISDEDQFELALRLATKKISTISPPEKRREKLYRYLAQKGFDSGIIVSVITRVMEK